MCHHPDYLKIADDLTHEIPGLEKDDGWANQTHYRQKYIYNGVPFVIDDARDSARGTMRHTERHYMHGARVIINIGAAGAIARDLKIGNFVIGDRAIRDNGIDWDLASNDEEALSDKEINDAIYSVVAREKNSKHVLTRGDVWSVCHKYYTRARLCELLSGDTYDIKAVDMEMGPLCTMAGFLNANYGADRGLMKIGNLFYISDLVSWFKQNSQSDTVNPVKRLLPYKKSVLCWTIKAIADFFSE